MEMSKSNGLFKAKNLVPQPHQQYRSWELSLQMVNHKKLTDFYQPNCMNSNHTYRRIAKHLSMTTLSFAILFSL